MNISEKAADYLNQYQRAQTTADRQAVVNSYKLFFEGLADAEQPQAQVVMDVLWPSIRQRTADLDALTQQANTLLRRTASPVSVS